MSYDTTLQDVLHPPKSVAARTRTRRVVLFASATLLLLAGAWLALSTAGRKSPLHGAREASPARGFVNETAIP
ncbi:MAG: hypothetical protein KDA41_22120 [Planctomycetales bacterium]|nr:hypothetical protein [Planctomycetales bacterium]